MLHPSLMRVFKGCRVLSVMTYFLIYFDCLEKRLFAIHKIESFQRRRKQTERRVESFLFLNAALCMFLTECRCRDWKHMLDVREGASGAVWRFGAEAEGGVRGLRQCVCARIPGGQEEAGDGGVYVHMCLCGCCRGLQRVTFFQWWDPTAL